MPKKKPIKGKPKVNEELDGLEIQINEFGQIESNFDVQNINRFLNREVDDKKLRNRDDITEEGKYLNTYKDKKYWVKYSDEEWEEMDEEEKAEAVKHAKEADEDDLEDKADDEDELDLDDDDEEDLEDLKKRNEDEEDY